MARAWIFTSERTRQLGAVSIEILFMQLTTVLVLAYAPRSATGVRVGAAVLALCLAAHIHWRFPRSSAHRQLILSIIWTQIVQVSDALVVTRAEYVDVMRWRVKMGQIDAVSDIQWDRVAWAWFMQWNGRWIGTRWEVGCRVRSATEKRGKVVRGSKNGTTRGNGISEGTGSRRGYVAGRLTTAIAIYLALDFLGWSAPPGAVWQPAFAVDKQYVFRRVTQVSLEELAIRTGAVLGSGVVGAAVLVQMHSFAAAVMVGLGIHDADEWPALFGHISDAWCLRRFWSLFWHQNMRHPFVSHASYITHNIFHIPTRNKILTRHLRVFIVFALCALLHLLTDNAAGVPFEESGAISFFMALCFGIALEDMFFFIFHSAGGERAESSRSRLFTSNALGYVWTLTFMVWTAPVWIYPIVRHIPPGKVKNVPFSVLDAIFG
ncbi:hypothetical protein PRK78_004574 [Emydomyces testavorans]|uniref:Wax synthase domain-containing protein n=1 Tax=Emydomyces testavorans TaxID=2070801 RepID=A0AAF0DLR7_9EURO|nr:hypothetical protein PRK78_004574 [Emydomyces testavorans]